ncbi:MAG: hypothetical protein O3A82_13330 [Verrucomicrobia bacterium]|nr:hypothetical protein [Verrucomicrobiota bacterium]MDA1047896.1 hypothetical protein [Verrucomicrobiota bacterium]
MTRSLLHIRILTLSSLFALANLAFVSSESFGQAVVVPAATPSRPGFQGFHSNLGLQEIVEVGVPLRTVAPASPVPSTHSLPPPATGNVPPPRLSPDGAAGSPSTSTGEPLLNASLSAGTRMYYTNNVLRTKANTMGSGVYEFNAGAGLGIRPTRIGDYITLIPRIDYMTQWAHYGEKTVKDLLGYHFSMIKGSAAIGLPDDWSLGLGLEYDYLSSISSGDKMFDAVAPTFSIQKILPFTEKSFLMIDSMIKYANTKRVIQNGYDGFPIPGVFADDGDNLQTALNATYIHSFGPDGKLLLMPSLGFARTSYKNNDHQGRVDYLFTLGASGIYQFREWLGVQTFINYSKMFTNEKGEALLDQSSKFRAWDIGAALTGNYRF